MFSITSAIRMALLGLLGSAIASPACTPGQWVNLTSIPVPRQEHGTAAIGNSTIAILGGIIPDGEAMVNTNLLQLYDIASNTWRTASPAPSKTNHPNVAVIGDKIYLLGGLVDGPSIAGMGINWVASTSCHVYDVATDNWSDLPPLPTGMERGSAIVGVHEEMIYLAGGMTVLQPGYQDAINSVISFNTTSLSWQRLTPAAAELPESRQHGVGGVIGNTFYVIGGRWYGLLNTRDTVSELDLTNIAAGWKTSNGHMPTSRGGLSGGAIGGKFYTFGGEGNPDSSTGVFDQTEVFDTESEEWSELQPMAVPRHGTQAAATGGLIYIPGGGLRLGGGEVTSHFDAYCP